MEVNAFKYGMEASGYQQDLYVYSNISNNLNYEVYMIGEYFESINCTLIAYDAIVTAITSPGIQPNQSVTSLQIGSIVDERIVLGKGEKTITSTVLNWGDSFKKVFNHAMNGTLVGEEFISGYGTGNVYLAPFSSLVSNPIRQKVIEEEARMISAGPLNYIFKGPVYSTDGTLEIPDGVGKKL